MRFNKITQRILAAVYLTAFVSQVAIGATIPDNTLRVGDLTPANNKQINLGNGRLRWDGTASKLKFSNNSGTNFLDLGSGSGGGAGEDFLGGAGFFESGIGNAVAYADAADVKPVDCSGGAPVAGLVALNTSSVMQGTNSVNFVKDAANRQGQGMAIPFTIEKTAQGSLVQIKGTARKVSGTYNEAQQPSKSDVTLWVYDVTNAKLIEVDSFNINPGASGGPGAAYVASFQASIDSTSYRLCQHISGTNASAFQLGFDEISLGRQTSALGPVVSDWESFTPTGTWVANTTYTGKFRRVGDSAEIDIGWVTSGAPTATTLNLDFSAVCTADLTKITNSATSNQLGVMKIVDTGSTSWPGFTAFVTATTVQPVIGDDTGPSYVTDAGISDVQPFTWAAGDYGNVRFTVPCSGWSSQFTSAKAVSSGRTLAARMYESGGGNLADATVAQVSLDATSYDNAGMANTGTSRITVPEAGIYDAKGSVGYANNATGVRQVLIYVNGVVASTASHAAAPVSQPTLVNVSDELKLNAGDYVELFGYQDSGGALAISANATHTYLSVKKNVDGAIAIGQPQVRARYKSAAGAALTASTPIDFDTKEYDSHNAVVTGAGVWKFTAPRAGLAKVKVLGLLNGATANTISIFKDGVQGALLAVTASNIGGTNGVLSGSVSIEVLAGQTIDVRPGSTAANFSADANACYIEIEMD